MDSLRSRILNELFVAPSVVLPIVGGATAWLLSWGFGPSDWLNAAGLIGVLGGIGWFATRMIFQMDSIAEKAMRDQIADRIRQEEQRLDGLAQRLSADRDRHASDSLSLLRINRTELESLAQTPGLQLRTMEIVRQARQLFWVAIEQLEQSCKLNAMAQKLTGPAKTKLLEQRQRLLQDARESAEHMQAAVDSFRNLADQQQERDIDRLQQELNLSIQAAQRSEERMRELESKPDYEAFLREGS